MKKSEIRTYIDKRLKMPDMRAFVRANYSLGMPRIRQWFRRIARARALTVVTEMIFAEEYYRVYGQIDHANTTAMKTAVIVDAASLFNLLVNKVDSAVILQKPKVQPPRVIINDA